jgi:hypothetical protein
VKRDAYFPHTCSEVAALVAPGVAERLDAERSYGVSWASRHDWKVLGRERRPDGGYRDRRKRGEKPCEEWLALPTPDAGVSREVAERARRNVELRVSPPKKNLRFWELSGGVLRCAECGRAMAGHTVAPKGRKAHYYYVCPKKVEEEWRRPARTATTALVTLRGGCAGSPCASLRIPTPCASRSSSR